MAAYTAIDDTEAYFQVKTYTGNGSTQSITLDGDTDLQPDLNWIKCRSAAENHIMSDSVRGVSAGWGNFVLNPNVTSQQYGGTGTAYVTSLNSDGFSVAANDAVNTNTETYVAWNWKESAVSGFDMVAYTGNGTDDTDISHSLSAVPHVILVKNRDAADPWRMQHKALGETFGLILNDTTVKDDDATAWSDEAPTSSVFTLGTSANTNNNTEDFIAYLFSEKQGFSKFGSYTANNNVDGVFIYLGFRPSLFICKKISGTESWYVNDHKRSPSNPTEAELYADTNQVEDTSNARIDLLSNGVKMRTTNGGYNTGTDTYIYMAFADAPFVNSNGVPCNAR